MRAWNPQIFASLPSFLSFFYQWLYSFWDIHIVQFLGDRYWNWFKLHYYTGPNKFLKNVTNVVKQVSYSIELLWQKCIHDPRCPLPDPGLWLKIKMWLQHTVELIALKKVLIIKNRFKAVLPIVKSKTHSCNNAKGFAD